MLNRALLERYRCPEAVAEFALNGHLSRDAGFFRFGSDTVCFGQSSTGSRSRTPLTGLYDTCKDVEFHDEHVALPLDPAAVIDNLRMERYAVDHNLNGTQPFSRKALRFAYYSLRPLFTV